MHPLLNSSGRRLNQVRILALALAAALTTAACSPGDQKGGAGGHGGPGGPGGMPPAEVTVVTVAPQEVPIAYEYSAQVAGSREVEIRARVAGILQQRLFTEGGMVKAGQSLYQIDPAPFTAALERAQADVASAKARLAQAERNIARLKPLWEAKAVAQREYDDAVSAGDIARADLQGAQAREREAALNLKYSKVESPLTGLIGRSQRSEGTLVAGPDVLLTTVTQTDPAHVMFGLPDADQAKWRKEAESGRLKLPPDGRYGAEVKLPDGTVYEANGRLSFADVRINPNTGTSDAKVEIANSKGVLRPGQFVRVLLTGAKREQAIVVPQRSVIEGPGGKSVMVVGPDQKLQPRPVIVGEWAKIGQTHGWVIEQGLKAGDRVLVDGMFKAMFGAPLKFVEMGSAPAASAPGAPPAAPAGNAKPESKAEAKPEAKPEAKADAPATTAAAKQ